MSVTRAVILAAGYGTRMLPASKSVPKELMPLVDTPAIEYIVDELVSSGIDHIIIVTSAGKRAIEDHFGRVHELEHYLGAKGDHDRLRRVQRTWRMADVAFVRQHEMGGIAHAVMTARRAVGANPFVLVLPDDVIVATPPATRQLLDVHERLNTSVVCVEEVPRARVSAYGVVQAELVEDDVYRVSDLVEKPAPELAPSNLAIVGRYVFTPAIFDAIAGMKQQSGIEMQITDAMVALIRHEPLHAAIVKGRRYDTGQPLGFLEAGIELMLQRPEYADGLRTYLRSLVDQGTLDAVELTGEKGAR